MTYAGDVVVYFFCTDSFAVYADVCKCIQPKCIFGNNTSGLQYCYVMFLAAIDATQESHVNTQRDWHTSWWSCVCSMVKHLLLKSAT